MLPPLYDLTPLTGKSVSENRTQVILNVEMKPRTKWVGIIAFVASLPVSGLLMLFMGIYGLVASPIIMVAAHLLFNARSQTGLKQRNIETLVDKKRSGDNMFYLCGNVVEVGRSDFGIIRRIITPVNPEKLKELQ